MGDRVAHYAVFGRRAITRTRHTVACVEAGSRAVRGTAPMLPPCFKGSVFNVTLI